VLQVDALTFKNLSSKKVEETEDLAELDEFNTTNFFILAAKNYQKSTIWWIFILSILAMRGANTFATYLVYFSVIIRITQAVSIVLQDEKLAGRCYVIGTSIIIILWLLEFRYENADIIHETEPT